MPPQLALVAAVLLLVLVNLLNNQWAPRAYLPTCLTATALLLGLYAATDEPWSAAGLSGAALGRGLGWGLALVGVVAVCFAVGAIAPATRRFFLDRRAQADRPATVAYQVLVRIPLGTVLLEEVAFRSVLLGLLTAMAGAGRAAAISAALFGLWHVLPSRDIAANNPAVATALGGRRRRIIARAVVGTAVAGLVLTGVVRYTGSLAPSMALHWATNGLGYLAAFLVSTRAAREEP